MEKDTCPLMEKKRVHAKETCSHAKGTNPHARDTTPHAKRDVMQSNANSQAIYWERVWITIHRDYMVFTLIEVHVQRSNRVAIFQSSCTVSIVFPSIGEYLLSNNPLIEKQSAQFITESHGTTAKNGNCHVSSTPPALPALLASSVRPITLFVPQTMVK